MCAASWGWCFFRVFGNGAGQLIVFYGERDATGLLFFQRVAVCGFCYLLRDGLVEFYLIGMHP